MKFSIPVLKTKEFRGIVEVEADSAEAAIAAVDHKIDMGTLQTSAIEWDDGEYVDFSFRVSDQVDTEQIEE